MSAYPLHTNAAGEVCGGSCVDSALSSESWRLTGFPVKSSEDCGFEIAWPDGIPFDHAHYVGSVDATQEKAA